MLPNPNCCCFQTVLWVWFRLKHWELQSRIPRLLDQGHRPMLWLVAIQYLQSVLCHLCPKRSCQSDPCRSIASNAVVRKDIPRRKETLFVKITYRLEEARHERNLDSFLSTRRHSLQDFSFSQSWWSSSNQEPDPGGTKRVPSALSTNSWTYTILEACIPTSLMTRESKLSSSMMRLLWFRSLLKLAQPPINNNTGKHSQLNYFNFGSLEIFELGMSIARRFKIVFYILAYVS